MNPGIIIIQVIKLSVSAVMCVLLTVALVRNKGSWFKLEEVRDREWAKRYWKWIKAGCIGATVVLWLAVSSKLPSLILDIPNMVNGEYLTAEGVILYDELGGAVDRVQDREFAILDAETGEEIHHLLALSTGLRKGEYVKVTYLPNSHLATINYRGDQP